MKFRALQWDYHAEAVLVERKIEERRRIRTNQESGEETVHFQEHDDDDSDEEQKNEKVLSPTSDDDDDDMEREAEASPLTLTKMVSI